MKMEVYPGALKHSMQYCGRSDWCFMVRVGAWNISSVSGKGGDFCEELKKRMID